MLKALKIGLRVLVAAVLGVWLLRYASLAMRDSGGMVADYGTAAVLVALLAGYGFVLFLLFGWPLLHQIGGSAGSLFWPGDDRFRVLPEYSIPEARVKEGRYTEAIAEYRRAMAEHPADVYPHVRISEIALEKLGDAALAEAELQAALARAEKPETIAAVAGRLADLYQNVVRDYGRAAAVLRQLQVRLPDSPEASRATDRIVLLEGLMRQPPPSAPPSKIQIRPSRHQ